MKRAILVTIVLAALIGLAAPAGAQGATLTADPASVDAAGPADITLTGSGYTDPAGGFLSPCPGAGGTVEGLTDAASQCDLGAIMPYTPDADGNWTAVMSVDIPAEGLVFTAGNIAATDSASVAVSVGGAPEAPVDAPTEGEGELAATGVESGLLAVLAIAVVAGGIMVISTSRRHGHI